MTKRVEDRSFRGQVVIIPVLPSASTQRGNYNLAFLLARVTLVLYPITVVDGGAAELAAGASVSLLAKGLPKDWVTDSPRGWVKDFPRDWAKDFPRDWVKDFPKDWVTLSR
jgi:hypothetical protein